MKIMTYSCNSWHHSLGLVPRGRKALRPRDCQEDTGGPWEGCPDSRQDLQHDLPLYGPVVQSASLCLIELPEGKHGHFQALVVVGSGTCTNRGSAKKYYNVYNSD